MQVLDGIGLSLSKDRIGLIHTLATLPEHPESVPINALVPIEGGDVAVSFSKGRLSDLC